MKKTFSIGLIQMQSGNRPAKNLAEARRRIARVAKHGAQIICLPELFLTEYFCQSKSKKPFLLAEPIPGGSTIKALQATAREHKVVIITSLYEREITKGKAHFYNTAVVIDADGRLKGKYRKLHIPDDLKNYYGETLYFEPGNLPIRSVKTRFGRVAALICWDQWFPEAARLAALSGAEIIFYPTAIGMQMKDRYGVNNVEHEAWHVIQRSHAIANTVFVAACNRVGRDQHLRFWGSSFVADPYGRVLAEASSTKEGDLIVTCDRSLVRQMRSDWPFLKSRKLKVDYR